VRGLAAMLVFFFASSAFAQQAPRGRWLRRITAAAACAASYWDAHTTAIAVRNGAREVNPLFADPLGRPRWGRIIGFKAASCAASFAVQEHFTRRRSSNHFWTGINVATTGIFSTVAIRNLKVAARPPTADPPR
jgi:hypothetical protein